MPEEALAGLQDGIHRNEMKCKVQSCKTFWYSLRDRGFETCRSFSSFYASWWPRSHFLIDCDPVEGWP